MYQFLELRRYHRPPMKVVQESKPDPAEPNGDTPTLRLFGLLEVIASRTSAVSLQGLVEETGLPKPTLHRMLQQLEGAGLLQREGDGRHYGTGVRLRRLAENLLLNDTHHGARHAVLRHLVEELGESCNVTALSGSEVVYLDRVETAAPLRFYLHPGSRVPAHCSASGKMFLAQMTPAQRQRLLAHAPLERYTAKHGDRRRPARDASSSSVRAGRLRDRRRGVPPRPGVHRGAGAAPTPGAPTSASRSRRRSCARAPRPRGAGCRRCGARRARSARSTPAPPAAGARRAARRRAPERRPTPARPDDRTLRSSPIAALGTTCSASTPTCGCRPSASATSTCPRSTRPTASTPTSRWRCWPASPATAA